MARRAGINAVQRRRPQNLSDGKLEKLFLHVKTEADLARRMGRTRPIVDELLVMLLTNAGLRAKELCRLNIGDLPASHGEDTLWVRAANNKIARKVHIDATLAKILSRFVNLYRQGAKQQEPLILSERGNRFGYISLYGKVRRLGQKSGIGKLHPEMLRHSYIARLYEAEQDLRFVQQQAGHASPRTTAKYAQRNHLSKVKPRSIKARGHATPHYTRQHNQPAVQMVTCEGCGELGSAESTQKIDSGQILCPECIKYFRQASLTT